MVIICGAGIVGLSVARELLNRGADDIVVMEKENIIGAHASGRNSGVLHAGIYYTADSLKAKLCLKGLFKEDILTSNKVGIRPQLVDREKKELVWTF